MEAGNVRPDYHLAKISSLEEGMKTGQRRHLWPDRRFLWCARGRRLVLRPDPAGVTYVNRPQGSTTRWPGSNPSELKGFRSTGKNAATVLPANLYARANPTPGAQGLSFSLPSYFPLLLLGSRSELAPRK